MSQIYTKVSDTDDIECQQSYKKRRPKLLISLMVDPWFILFALCLLSSILFTLFWFYDNNIDFHICSAVSIIMFMLALYKFCALFSGKKTTMQTKKCLNRKLKMKTKHTKARIVRGRKAMVILSDAQKRITRINIKNRNNSKYFADIPHQMKTAGIGDNICHNAATIHKDWQQEYIRNEKQTLNKMYNRFIKEKTAENKHVHVLQTLSREQFNDFQYHILPIIYRSKLVKLNVFDELDLNNDGTISVKQLGQYLDKIAEIIEIGDGANAEYHEMDIFEPQKQKTKNKESLFAADYDIVDNDDDMEAVEVSKQKESLFADDYNIVDNEDCKGNKKRRKIGKLKHDWNRGQTGTETVRYTPSGKVIKADASWVRHKSVKVVHPVHESVDALHVNALVSQAQKLFSVAEDDDVKETKQKPGKLKMPQKKEPLSDESWIKHKSEKVGHVAHDSVDVLELNRLVSQAQIHRKLTPVGENEEQTPATNELQVTT